MEREWGGWGRGEEGAMGDGREAGRRGGRNPKRSEKWIEREGRIRRGTAGGVQPAYTNGKVTE